MAANAWKASDSIPFTRVDAFSDPEKLIAAYFSSSTLGLCILDARFHYLAINNTLAEMNSLPAADHIGKTVRDILGDFADQVEPNLQRVLTTGQPVLNLELAAVLPRRKEIGYWIEHFFPIKNERGAVIRIGVVVAETTEQKRMVETLQQLSGNLKHQKVRLQMLLDVSGILSANWNMQLAFPRISARIRRVFRQEYAGFSSHANDSGLLVLEAEDFPLRRNPASTVPPCEDNSPGTRALHEGSALVFSREQMQKFDAGIAPRLLAEGFQSLCCIPLLRPKGSLGVLMLGSTRKDAFQPDDVSLLNQVAAQLALALENHRTAIEVGELKQRLADERKYLESEVRTEGQFSEIVGESPALKKMLDQIATVSASDATVLVLGETGTGKELVAHAIHRLSHRNGSPFIKVNCAAIPTGLLESELFGHEKGAFTGAVSQKIGRMELAHGGTLFLDEVGEIPLELQPKLLRVLQDQEFERLGSPRTIKINVRLIAATNRDLARRVSEREFRSDLYYRLHVFPIRVPPLRERCDDIPLLVRHFVHRFAQRMNRNIETIPKETMHALTEWPWPGNVRELENLMERSVILSEGNALRVPLAELHISPTTLAESDHTLDSAERAHIIGVLRETGGVLSGPNGAARRLGLKRTTLQSKMQRLKITARDYSGDSGDTRS
jgi:formate hydrogenlyase transcriptional activator